MGDERRGWRHCEPARTLDREENDREDEADDSCSFDAVAGSYSGRRHVSKTSISESFFCTLVRIFCPDVFIQRGITKLFSCFSFSRVGNASEKI